MRHHGWTYIDIAAGVLQGEGRPLGAEEMVRIATEDGILRSGARSPAAAMRARLSSDVRQKGFGSAFQRVGPNRFALRHWELPEYFAPPFKKELPEETVVCVPQDAIGVFGEHLGIERDWGAIRALLGRGDTLVYRSRRVAESQDDVRQIVAYAVLRDRHGRLLTYRRGQYSSAPALIRGARCLGFGGHVLREDAENLFGIGDAGVMHAAYREIAEELDGTLAKRLDAVGVICDDSSPEGVRHLGIVIEGELPIDFDEERSSRERAVNDLRFLSPTEAWRRYHEFEFWSQLVLRELFWKYRVPVETIVRPRHRPGRGDVVLVTGEIATGKTTFSNLLCKNLGFEIVSTRKCVASVVGAKDFGRGVRTQFQQRAAELIAAEGGVEQLADEIARAVRALSGRAVIDGVRHRGTLEALRRRFGDLVVMFIDCARDDAFRNFQAATGRNASIGEFRAARAHKVEEEVRWLKHDADAYVFNGGEPRAMLDVFRAWWVASGERGVGDNR